MFHTVGELAAQRLTGRTRFRRGWFRPVQQVEVVSPKPWYPRAPQPGRDVWAEGSYTYWRDERMEDRTVSA